jgi:hypothetical protein
VRIPFTDNNNPTFEPASIAIPIDMTVIWFNEDQLPHTVTQDTNESSADATSSFDSGLILPGGFYMYRFTEQGTYDYHDRNNPSAIGRIVVGDAVEIGDNMDMLLGGDILPFNASQLARFNVAFVPHENITSIPPKLGLTYNVSIANGTSLLFSSQYVDSDGILDLELVPTGNATEHFVTWGPDFSDADPAPFAGSDGTYHVQGPILIENGLYLIQVSVVARDEVLLDLPITDTFALPALLTL